MRTVKLTLRPEAVADIDRRVLKLQEARRLVSQALEGVFDTLHSSIDLVELPLATTEPVVLQGDG